MGNQDLLLGKEDSLDLLYQMKLIRRFEERIEQLFTRGKLYGTMHLCIGQEATAVGAMAALNKKDKITSTHRGHGLCIAKKTDINLMMAELFGKATGLSKGKGGSMHLADLDNGNLGANGILGAGQTHAVGAALTSKMRELGYVVVTFFGDGASNEGAVHESMNLAAVWNLPVIFFCENNEYGMSGSIKDMVKAENIADRAQGYGMPGHIVNGSDVLEVMKVTQEAVYRARNGLGPTFIEAKTYRWKGHSKSDARKYRTREEETAWMDERDPIVLFKRKLVEANMLSPEEEEEIIKRVENEVEDAVQFAEDSPVPSLDSLMEDIYA